MTTYERNTMLALLIVAIIINMIFDSWLIKVLTKNAKSESK